MTVNIIYRSVNLLKYIYIYMQAIKQQAQYAKYENMSVSSLPLF